MTTVTRNRALGTLQRLCHTRLGHLLLQAFVLTTQYRVFSGRTVHAMKFDLLRLRARMRRHRIAPRPATENLHLGCGVRVVPGWLNVDVSHSQEDVDITYLPLPWEEKSFSSIVSQHVIEHLDLESELLPLLKEFRRILRTGGELWLSCPDLGKICRAYAQDKGAGLLADRMARSSVDAGMSGIPSQHYINYVFVQSGEHRNLLDFELLEWLVGQAGFRDCRQVKERDLLARFPEFPARNDDFHSVYVRAVAS
jgi:predicted SAM-dependent methyltransferase